MLGIKIRLVPNLKIIESDPSIGDCRITESLDNRLGFKIDSSQVVISHVESPYHMGAWRKNSEQKTCYELTDTHPEADGKQSYKTHHLR